MPRPAQTADAIEETSLLSLVGRLHQVVRRALNRRLEQQGAGLTGEQALLLTMIARCPATTQQDLAERLSKDKAGVSRLLVGLEGRGLLERLSPIEDRRANAVTLTASGRSALRLIDAELLRLRAAAFDGISEKNAATCRRVLQAISENLDEG